MPNLLDSVSISGFAFQVTNVNKEDGIVFLERVGCPEHTKLRTLLISIEEYDEWKKHNKKALKIVRRAAA